MKKVITKQEFNIEWLVANQYYIELPSEVVSKIVVLGYLSRMIKSGNAIQVILGITKGASPTQLYEYQKNKWFVNGSKINKLKLLENTLLQLNIRDKKTDKLTGNVLKVLHREIMVNADSHVISVQKALDIREELVKEEEAKERKFESVNEIEEIALNICQMFASGRINIYEACARYNVSYLEFFKWVIGMDSVRQMYEDAVRVAKFVTESQVYTITANLMLDRLKNGYTSATDIVYGTLWVNGEKRFIETGKRTSTREITISELIRVIATLKNDAGVPASDIDDFSNLSDQELWDYINEIRGRVATKRLPVKKEDQEENNQVDGQDDTV